MFVSSRLPVLGAGLLIATVFGLLLAPAYAQPSDSPESSRLAPDASRLTSFDIPAQNLDEALIQFGQQSRQELFYEDNDVVGLTSNPVVGEMTRIEAMRELLRDTGLEFEQTASGGMMIGTRTTLNAQRADNAALAGQNTVGQRRKGIEEIIVTGQKREERIQDVPIAISAFTMEDLKTSQIAGGPDLHLQVPNMTFTKTNFTGYSIQIRGIGTQAISATTDPAVAVGLNNTTFIRNRFFEQEFYDLERLEVLRGPQGTLYGRNATGGVINVITNKPELGVWSGMIDVEAGNYNTRRLRGHFNMPIGDTFAVRGAYASTKRDGYDYNLTTENSVNGRDLWTGRLSLAWQPTDRLRMDLIWERFDENDDRSRTSKQLCHRDPGPDEIGGANLAEELANAPFGDGALLIAQAATSQGCQPGSLYSDNAFGTVNGLALPFVFAEIYLHAGLLSGTMGSTPGSDEPGSLLPIQDPYGGRMQSRNLREIESVRDPVYRANADLIEFSLDFDLTDGLTFTSQTVYNSDEVYSFQDFSRFNSDPIFIDTSGWASESCSLFGCTTVPSPYQNLAPRPEDSPVGTPGVYCDPQIGCTDRVAGFDISQARSRQFSQEFRLQSSFAGPVNFSAGMNHTTFETVNDYYVFYNLLSILAETTPLNTVASFDSSLDRRKFCSTLASPFGAVPTSNPSAGCPWIDPQPIDTSENFEGDGHNYFRSKNPYKLRSSAVFGELYWNMRDDLKLTAGLRYTDDTKTFTPVPSQVLLASGAASGVSSIGYPEKPAIEQRWGEFTGRLVLDWQPVLDFTDETLVYASFSRGYKGGGANPPSPGFATVEELAQMAIEAGSNPGNIEPVVELNAVEYGRTFEPEFVNAYEIGTKNTLFGGAATLNLTAFYYDYTDYQVSQIRDRTAVNENFDSEMWGLELETVFAPTLNWQLNANVGYLKTEIAEGETSIDIMNRTQGNDDYVVVKPWIQLPSNCVVPADAARDIIVSALAGGSFTSRFARLCGGVGSTSILAFIGASGNAVDFSEYPELNGGAGIRADLGGNELPNSPRWTANFGAQYGFDLTRDWRATARLDYYWQDESYHRVYNAEPYDRLKSWSNTNLSFWVNNPVSGITVEAYVKNVFDETQLTGAFLNSDDTGLTTNVFTMDPRLIGVSVRKEF